jgi:hypothetical protein
MSLPGTGVFVIGTRIGPGAMELKGAYANCFAATTAAASDLGLLRNPSRNAWLRMKLVNQHSYLPSDNCN